MDNLYFWNQSCQYEKNIPNSIVIPVLADGGPHTNQKRAGNWERVGCKTVTTPRINTGFVHTWYDGCPRSRAKYGCCQE